MRSLILHIGTHKTGSTTLQKQLELHKNELKAINWRLFNRNPDGRKDSYGNCNNWVNFKGDRAKFEGKLNLDILKELKKGKDNIILSSEELSWIFDENHVQEISSLLKEIFSEIKVIIYIRRQDLHLVSHYHQGFRFKESTASRFFGRELTPLPVHYDYFEKYLDHNIRYNMWCKCFGERNVIVRKFEKKSLVNQDIVSDFLSINNLNIELKEKKISKSNVSISKKRLLLNYYLISKDSSGYLVRFANKCIASEIGEVYLPSKEEAEQVYLNYKKKNDLLLERLGLDSFDENFDSYPEECNGFSEEEIKYAIENFSNISSRKIEFRLFATISKAKSYLRNAWLKCKGVKLYFE